MSQKISLRRITRFRPTVDTKFHINYNWWESSGRDFRLYLRDQLCDECRERFSDHQNTENVDWVDPDTGEVHQTDALRECLRTRCANDPEYINERLPLASACFRIFLANNDTSIVTKRVAPTLALVACGEDSCAPWEVHAFTWDLRPSTHSDLALTQGDS